MTEEPSAERTRAGGSRTEAERSTDSRVLVGARRVSRRFGPVKALKGVSLDLAPGVTGLLGRNGAGKSTLVRILVGVDSPDEGDVVMSSRGEPLAARNRRRLTGWLPQVFGYPSSATVLDFLKYAAWLKEVPRRQMPPRLEAAAVSAGLTPALHVRLRTLSGGTLRRAGLAAALIADPPFLVLDEPTAGLDPEQRENFHACVRGLLGTTVLLSTHLLEDVEAVTDRIHVLDEGSLVWSGDAAQLASAGDRGLQGVARLRSGFLSVLPNTRVDPA